jgi:hypothetical protein
MEIKAMTKKLLGFAMLVLLGAVTVNAAPISCPVTTGSGLVTSGPSDGTPDPNISGAVFTCTLPTLPVGDVITSISVLIDNDYSLGNSSANNEVTYSYTLSGLGFNTTLGTYVLGNYPTDASPTQGGILSQSGAPSCVNDSAQMNECDSFGDSFSGGRTFKVTGSSSWVEGSLAANGAVDIAVSFDYTYGPGTASTTTPEPSTLALIGVGLLGLGLAFRFRQTA